MNRFREMFGFYTVPRVRDGSWGEIESNYAHAERNIKIATFNTAVALVLTLVRVLLKVL